MKETCSSVYCLSPLEPSRHMYQQRWSALQCAVNSEQIQDHRSGTEKLMRWCRKGITYTPHGSG